MQFQVPQFLDVEDKIIGPFTLKQFIYLLGGAGLAYITWRFIPYVGLLVAAGCLGLGAALAFYRPNQKPFAYLIESAYNFALASKLYVWRRKKQEKMETHLDLGNFQTTVATGALPVASTSQSKLSDLSWSIDLDKNVVEAPPSHNDSLVL